MVISLPVQAFFASLLSIFGDVPVLSHIIGFARLPFSLYAFLIPPNFIEIVTQLIPFGVYILASLPAVIFMPVSLVTTFVHTAGSAVSALPSVPGYVLKLGSRVLFSAIAQIFAVISLVIDLIAVIMLILFAIITSILFEILTLSIMEDAPKIAILVFALILVIVALIIDLVGILILRAPDMISEYAYSVLKSAAMVPVLSTIIPSLAAAPAALKPDVLIEGLTKIAIIILIFPLAVFGALVSLIYRFIKEMIVWIYTYAPGVITFPLRVLRAIARTVDRVTSRFSSVSERAVKVLEAGVTPY
jgi:hypothetical protein